MTKCYKLEKNVITNHKNLPDTKEFIDCQICGTHIYTKGGPGVDMICEDCGDKLMQGEFKGLAYAPPQKVYEKTCEKLDYYIHKSEKLEARLETINELYENLDDNENVARVAKFVEALTEIMQIAEIGAIGNENESGTEYETILAICSDLMSDLDNSDIE